MIYKFRVVSDEIELFSRNIEIPASSSFLEFHEAIQTAVGYDSSQLASFFLADKNWDREDQITLLDMSDGEDKLLLMSDELLETHLSAIDQNLVYVFDFFNDRAFYITLTSIKEPNADTQYPHATGAIGEAPEQIKLDDLELDMASMEAQFEKSIDSGYDDDYDDDDLDAMESGSWESIDDYENL